MRPGEVKWGHENAHTASKAEQGHSASLPVRRSKGIRGQERHTLPGEAHAARRRHTKLGEDTRGQEKAHAVRRR